MMTDFFEKFRDIYWGNLADVTEETIMNKIMSLNEFKAYGGDKVCNLILKKSASAFVKPLKLIFDKSISTGGVPIEWREANVTPLFKKGSKLVRSNYRPVSLTSVICKIIESIVRDPIMRHLKINEIITPGQHGFVPNKACMTNLLETLDIITDAVNKRIFCGTIS